MGCHTLRSIPQIYELSALLENILYHKNVHVMIQSLGSNGYLSLVYSQIAHSITNYCAPGSTLVFGSIYSYMWYLCYFLRAARSVSGFHAMIQCLKNMLGRRVLCWVVCTDVLQAFGATKCRTLPTQRLRHMLIRLAVN